jgi:Flp pilus assembly protein protease CpaA
MIIDILLLFVGITGLIIGTYTDIRWREVPDFLSYILIILAIFLRLIYSITTSDWYFLLYGIIGMIIGFGIGIIMYYTGQWGGGDSKFIIGLFGLFATTPIFLFGNLIFNFPFSFILVLLLNIFFVGAAYSLIYAIVMTFINLKLFRKEFLSQHTKYKIIANVCYIVFSIMIIISFFLSEIMKILIFVVAFFVPVTFYLFIYIKSVEKSCFVKKYSVEKLTEGDWVIDDIKIKGKKIYSQKDLGISKEQIRLLKKNKINFVMVKEGVPFLPAFLLAFALTYFVGNWLFMIFMMRI